MSSPGPETRADLTGMLRAVRKAMATITATGDYDELIEAVGDEVGGIVPYHSLRLFFLDDATDELFPVVIRSTLERTETTDPSSPRLRLPLGRGVTGRIGETREPMLIDDIAAHPDVYYAPGTEPIDESFIGVPLVFRDELVGVLTVSQHGVGQYTEEMLALMEILGVAISAAIGNRRVVEAEARARHEEERLRQLHTTFIGNVSHELRTPLTTALGFLDLAREREDHLEELPELIERSRRGVERLRILIERLLEIVSIEAGRQRLNLDSHRLGDLIVAGREKATVAADRVKLTGDEELKVVVDAPRFVHLVAELFDNASRHGPPGGTIDVEIDAGPEYVEVVVRDEGNGIPENLAELIFDRFVQGGAATQAQGGTGLGLSLARSIARWHDGDLAVRPDAATTFVLTVPHR